MKAEKTNNSYKNPLILFSNGSLYVYMMGVGIAMLDLFSRRAFKHHLLTMPHYNDILVIFPQIRYIEVFDIPNPRFNEQV